MNRTDRHVKFVGNRLRQRRARVLSDFDFAGEGGDVAVLVNMNPRANVVRYSLIAIAAAGFASLLCNRTSHGNDEHNAKAERLDEIAAIESKVVVRHLEQLITLRFDLFE